MCVCVSVTNLLFFFSKLKEKNSQFEKIYDSEMKKMGMENKTKNKKKIFAIEFTINNTKTLKQGKH